ncbi:hypothetical protein S40285_09880 [Stachybotrys chlorohalonatus IBT 40285]|uniref:Uncharacterized protein n=1 Tax=Stachybotrys chlorohalonatus (strain IBT 40285) TaxID=1283841 RepID=A0A084QUY4_STAC4|nr:hypothetical protein S40285_09880 [Stachybotrys chlorohalonata IBT 40285]
MPRPTPNEGRQFWSATDEAGGADGAASCLAAVRIPCGGGSPFFFVRRAGLPLVELSWCRRPISVALPRYVPEGFGPDNIPPPPILRLRKANTNPAKASATTGSPAWTDDGARPAMPLRHGRCLSRRQSTETVAFENTSTWFYEWRIPAVRAVALRHYPANDSGPQEKPAPAPAGSSREVRV